jgi:hypothetical protein
VDQRKFARMVLSKEDRDINVGIVKRISKKKTEE